MSDFVEGEYLVSKFSQLKSNNSAANISFKVSKRFTTNIKRIHYLTELSDQTLLISDNTSKELQHIKLEKTSVQMIDNLSRRIHGMAVSPSGDVLVSTFDTRLKVFDIKTGEMTNSIYSVHPLHSCQIHVTKENRVVIGAKSSEPRLPVIGRRVVIVMDQEGKHMKEYEHDSNNKPLFTHPDSITTTSNGNTFVVDRVNDEGRSKVVVLEQGGDVIQIYSGHPHINTESSPFKPVKLLTMASGSVIVTELNVDTLNILNNYGQLISYHDLLDIGIKFSFSLALSSSGHLYIGCSCKKGSPDTYKAKLYELEYFGL
ncbi:Hypothetical predicted protein [Mytilus galloprovincialis]|uniref:Uncharacterized protein n=1 Tax=Mytilus galloprovincialis TaxID=29158 RepID=A0A8B6DHA2_MYTGA|nr:Hypothetical predicted protein [Mytilus galloprovincialis]